MSKEERQRRRDAAEAAIVAVSATIEIAHEAIKAGEQHAGFKALDEADRLWRQNQGR